MTPALSPHPETMDASGVRELQLPRALRDVAWGDSFRLEANHHEPLTHYLFRFPSKFHPPVTRWLIESYSSPGDLVVDPLVGSGTTLVESRTLGRHSIGLDVDPLSCFVSHVKSQRLDANTLKDHWAALQRELDRHERPRRRYEAMNRADKDIAESTFKHQARDVAIPPIPNLNHWFRRYVIIDLARIKRAIDTANLPAEYEDFFKACFASIIRSASNADPIPVSGLEVTQHMLERDKKGREINPFALFRQKVSSELQGAEAFASATRSDITAGVIRGSALNIATIWRQDELDSVDLILTSPPYCNAVEYHRRHKLELYWLDLVQSQHEHVELSRKYIGRRWGHGQFSTPDTPKLASTLRQVEEVSPRKAVALSSYFSEMDRFLQAARAVLRRRGRSIVVIGDSITRGLAIPTHAIVSELGQQHLELEMVFSYEIRNRYMQYFRHNGANIKRDYVLVFRKR